MIPAHEFGGDWTEQKLNILDDYLSAYCTIFQSNPRAQHFDTAYIDAFAGTGLIQPKAIAAKDGELFSEFAQPDTIQFLRGSAARALEHTFTRYIFIEKSAARIAELEALKAASRFKERVAIRKGDANKRILDLIESTDWKKWRAVVFLDPYGMQVEWETIRRLGETMAVDLWFLFPLGQAVMRLLQKNSEPPREWQQALDRIFGTHDWYGRFYETDRQPDWFEGEVVSTRRVADWHAVAAFMIERLKTVFHAVEPRPGVLMNSQNVPLYLFCFASANPKGAPTALKIARDLLKRLTT